MFRILYLLCMFSLLACASVNKASKDKPTEISVEHLSGKWEIKDVQGFELPAPMRCDVNLTDSTIFGNLPCNRFSGKAEFADGKVSFGRLMSTRRYCENMPTEQAIINYIQDNETLELRGDTLIFFMKGKRTLLLTKWEE